MSFLVLCYPDSGSVISRLGVVGVGRKDDHAPFPHVQDTVALPKPAGQARKSVRRSEPSWGRVLVNTVESAVSRRRTTGPERRRASRSRPWLARWLWRSAFLAVALAGVAVIALWLVGGLAGTSSRGPRVPSPGTGPAASAAGAQARAAAWITAQVSDNAMVACYAPMCAALQEQGVAAGRLMPLRPAATSPLGASVLVTSGSAGGQLASRYAPALIASFGSGGTRVEVRAVEPGGVSAYRAALRADIAARRAAGSQLLRNPRIRFSGPGAAQLRASEVDTRLLATLATLASQYSFRVTAFGDAAPGAPLLFREVTISGIGRSLPTALAMVRAQNPPYLPARIAITGQTGLSIEFAAPSPLGLLSPVLDADTPRPAAVGGAFPPRLALFR
jgi:hypothetical protein